MGPFVIFILVGFAVATSEGRTLDGSDNVFCGPFPTVVAVDPVNHNVFPYYVTLHRCQGSNGLTQPSLKKCLPANYTEIRVKTNKGTDITLKNHTKCEPGCAKSSADCDSNSLQHFNSNNCVCDCRHKTSPLRPCGHNHEWDQHKCKCVCTNKIPQICSLGKNWSDKQCSCVGGSAAAKQDRENNSKTHMFITLLVLEAVMIAILVSALIHWVRKKSPAKSTNTPDSSKPLTSDDDGCKVNYGADSGP